MVQDAEWAAKPCSERWSPNRRPCPFYQCGRDCERTWASEAGDLYVVCRAAMLAYLTGIVLYLTYLLHGSRRERRREGGKGKEEGAVFSAGANWVCTGAQSSAASAGEALRTPPRA